MKSSGARSWVCLCLGLSLTAGLQAAEPVLEEIVVTAQKRAEGLQETPIAVTALTAQALEDRNVTDISQVAAYTPNMVFDTTSPISGLSSGAVIFIRGIGNTDFSLTTDPGVGTYVDGVYMSRSAGGVLDVLDVERIEVLRGPQGTLFGRNTIGGAVNVTGRKPGDTLGGDIAVTLGEFDRFDVRGTLDIPLSDELFTTLAVSSKERDGYVKRVLVGDRLGDEDRLAARFSALWLPSDTFDLNVVLDYSEIDEASAGSTIEGFTPGAGTVGYSLALFGDIPTGLASLAQYVTDGSDDRSFGTGVSGTELDIFGTAVTATWHVANMDLKYIGAYRETEGEFYRDPDNSPFAITETLNNAYEHEQITHELQLSGDALDGQLKYIAGLYFLDEEGTDNVFVPVFLPDPTVTVGFPAVIGNFADVDNSSSAAYAQGTWQLNDTFAVTGGVRYTKDEKEFAFTQYIGADLQGNGLPFFPGAVNENGVFTPGLLPLIGNGSGEVDDEFTETTFKLGIDATLEDGTLLYYSFSQGFKSGGFVLRYVESVPAPRVFEPETLDTHEVGVKWQGLDDRLRVNGAVYVSEYDEVQVTFFDQLGGPITANAGKVDIVGAEIELTALVGGLMIDLGLGYTDAEYKSINPIAGLSLAIDESASLVNTPEFTANLGVEYEFSVGTGLLALRADYAWTDDVYNDSQNSPFLFQDAYDTLNLAARWTLDDTWRVTAFVTNATDERFIVSGDSNFGLGFHETNYNRPREYGLTVQYSF